MKYLSIFLFWTALSCSTQKSLDPAPFENAVEEPVELEERLLDELEVTAPRNYVLPKYNPSASRKFDLIHTALDIRFDWINEHVIGRADLQLSPFAHSRKTLELDARNFEILRIYKDNKDLFYQYDGNKIVIDLNREYSTRDSFEITIDYIAKPSEGPQGGSAAITSDRGLFFINPRGEEKNKPTQIWTQGETENNSRWFPTIDKPNENSTQDIRITVDKRFKTLSNGLLIGSVEHSDGTRTDHWEMMIPHAPYLFMMAVGDFAVVKDKWKDTPVDYYVEPEYEAHAREIFAHTPEMIEFFSEILDYPYPWQKFSQIITRDYVSGAMENTTAVIYGEFIQKTSRELLDEKNDYIIAHELFHHWFGDLVTCESWANLTLQEGFANYAEYLWEEYKYGTDAAGYQRMHEKEGYLGSIMQTGVHPLIHYGYNDKEDMFDGHSYNKGGLVIHMLRSYLGDEIFFRSLNKYLRDNAHSAVEADELRMAFEDASGEDLNWFFDQWYMQAGHPELDINYSFDSLAGELLIAIEQTQNPESVPPIFQFPVDIALYSGSGEESVHKIFIDKRSQEFRIKCDKGKPAVVLFDRNDELLFLKNENKSMDEFASQYRVHPAFIHRYEALTRLDGEMNYQEIFVKALDDPHFSLRVIGLENLSEETEESVVTKVRDLATNDPSSFVRSKALLYLANTGQVDGSRLLINAIQTDSSYTVIGESLKALMRLAPGQAKEKAIALKSEKTKILVPILAEVFAELGDASQLSFFADNMRTVNLFSAFSFYDNYFGLLSAQNDSVIDEHLGALADLGKDQSVHMFYRFLATNTLSKLKNETEIKNPALKEKIQDLIDQIKATETNEILIQRYRSF